jgi:hypothetical protein
MNEKKSGIMEEWNKGTLGETEKKQENISCS